MIAECNENAGWEWHWTYDDAGNITSKTEINLETSEKYCYYYDYADQAWGDLLTFYDSRIFSYDANGNLTNDRIWEYTWQQGRQLASMTNGSKTWVFEYDANGMRIGRSNGTKTYSYLYTNGLLSRMILGDDTLCFAYDAVGAPLTVNYNGTTFYYVTNLQGDVIAILDRTGYPVVQYTYNAWGELLSATGPMLSSLGALNPLLYRGYVYDRETELYYLQSRYYDPVIGRFINLDAYVSTGQGILGNNMFTYCGNNPVNRMDPTGEKFIDWLSNTWNGICDFFVGAYEYVTNSDEDTAKNNLINDGFTFYKGVPVFSVDWLDLGAFSFGVIVMGSGNLRDEEFNDTINHEYGHFVHMSMVGPTDFFVTTAIPSLAFAGLSNVGIFPDDYYYDLPWERTADYLGGVEREYLPGTNAVASIFWLYTLLYARITP